MRDAYAYVPQVGLILRVAEGTGDNLLGLTDERKTVRA